MASMTPTARSHAAASLLIALVGSAVAGCGGETPAPAQLVSTESHELVRLKLDPASFTLRPGDTTITRAVAEVKDSTLIDVTNEVRWSSSDESGLTVKAGGWLQVHKPGEYEVIVRHRSGAEGRASVAVREGGSASPIQSLTLAAPTQAIPAGETIRLAATALYEDGNSADVSSEVSWSATPDRLAQIALDGGLTGFDTGTVAVTASHPSGATASLEVMIVPGSAPPDAMPQPIESIAISALGRLIVGDSARLTVFGVRPDGTAVDVSDLVTWMPATGGAISVDGIGNVIGLMPGTGSITAVYGPDLSASINILVEELSADSYGSDPS